MLISVCFGASALLKCLLTIYQKLSDTTAKFSYIYKYLCHLSKVLSYISFLDSFFGSLILLKNFKLFNTLVTIFRNSTLFGRGVNIPSNYVGKLASSILNIVYVFIYVSGSVMYYPPLHNSLLII